MPPFPNPISRQPALRWFACGCLAVAALAACATPGPRSYAQVSTGDADRHLDYRLGAEACRDAIVASRETGWPGLDPAGIRLANWNLEKGNDPSWRDDLERVAVDADIVLLQEASLREDTIAELDASRFWSFAPGFRSSDQISGVLTMSVVEPVTQCSLVWSEPFLRTPKATNITQFRLTGSEQTLVVVNMHAVNFSLGLRSFRRQFGQVRAVLALHEGPIVLSGDLNTWRDGRLEVVRELADELGLAPVRFAEDHRVSRFGQPLDHIFVRGLTQLAANTLDVTTSDHNPMSVTLAL